MSFMYNPFLHIEILCDNSKNYVLYCPSCGAEIPIRQQATIPKVFEVMDRHVIESHRLTPLDTLGWGST